VGWGLGVGVVGLAGFGAGGVFEGGGCAQLFGGWALVGVGGLVWGGRGGVGFGGVVRGGRGGVGSVLIAPTPAWLSFWWCWLLFFFLFLFCVGGGWVAGAGFFGWSGGWGLPGGEVGFFSLLGCTISFAAAPPNNPLYRAIFFSPHSIDVVQVAFSTLPG